MQQEGYSTPLKRQKTIVLRDVGEGVRAHDTMVLDDTEPLLLPPTLMRKPAVFIQPDGSIDWADKVMFDDVSTSSSPKRNVSFADSDDLFDLNLAGLDDVVSAVCQPTPTPQCSVTPSAATKEQCSGKKKPRYVRWMITLNNPTVSGAALEERLTGDAKVRGWAFQKEMGENNTPHFQIYLEFKKPEVPSTLHAAIGTDKLWMGNAKGSKAQCIAYCSKEETRIEGPWVSPSFVDCGTGQGKRSDIDIVASKVIADGITADLWMDHPGVMTKYSRHLKSMLHDRDILLAKSTEEDFWKAQADLRRAGLPWSGQQQRELVLLIGPTGVGKTTIAKLDATDLGEGTYEKDGVTKWWDGYNGEGAVIMDEFKGDSYGAIEVFNRMTNRGVYQGETKGGHINMTATHMYFTTNRHPCQWWKRGSGYSNWSDPRFQAVARRFAKVMWWNDDKELTVLTRPVDGEDDSAWIRFWKWKAVAVEDGHHYDVGSDRYFSLD